MLYYINVIVVFISLVLLPNEMEAADLHAIIVCDTLADNIGVSVKQDLLNIHSELQNAATATGMKYNEIVIADQKTTVTEILIAVDQLKVGSDDTVFFYFSGHGYRHETKKNKWPNLFITSESYGIDLMKIVDKLTAKKPRLVFAMADTCNNVIKDAFAVPLKKKVSLATLKIGYKKLFLETKGLIITSAAKPGQFSWGSKFGGVYTNAVISNLKDEVAKGLNANWSSIFERSAYDIINRQTPQWEFL